MVGPVEGAAVGPVVDPAVAVVVAVAAVAVVVAVAAVAAVIGQDRTGQYSVVLSSAVLYSHPWGPGRGIAELGAEGINSACGALRRPCAGLLQQAISKVGKDRTAQNCTVQY